MTERKKCVIERPSILLSPRPLKTAEPILVESNTIKSRFRSRCCVRWGRERVDWLKSQIVDDQTAQFHVFSHLDMHFPLSRLRFPQHGRDLALLQRTRSRYRVTTDIIGMDMISGNLGVYFLTPHQRHLAST
jgi:hypothetical protein